MIHGRLVDNGLQGLDIGKTSGQVASDFESLPVANVIGFDKVSSTTRRPFLQDGLPTKAKGIKTLK